MKRKTGKNIRVDIPVSYADAERGLTDDEVRERTDAGLVNISVSSVSKTVWQIIASNVFTYFNLLFFIFAAGVIAVGRWLDLAFMGVIFFNTVIGIAQELRSKRKLDRLSILTSPRATVVRDGSETELSVSALVRDDIVVLRSGEQIYADAVVVSGSCRANESLVTGEADEIEKTTGDVLLSGSFVTAGVCRARLTAVGADSYASKLTLEAKRAGRGDSSEMMRSLQRLVRMIGVIVIPFGALLLLKETSWLGRDMADAVTSTVAALIGMIPEGLYLLTSVALLAGVIRLSQKQTLVHEMACIETLARVDTLCVDKTGTITEPDMAVEEVVPLGDYTDEKITSIMTCYCAAMPDGNDTMRALVNYFSGEPEMTPSDFMPFSSKEKYGGVTLADGKTYLLGAPEILLGDGYRDHAAAIDGYASRGVRVMLLCESACPLSEAGPAHGVSPAALIILTNKIRRTAPDTIRYFTEQGVSVRVISGDNPVTVSEVARLAGVPNADRAIDARLLVTDEDYAAAAEKYVVFGRVTPDGKRKLISALKAAGHTVAMTGDGVNDVLALKEADCSVAMATGSAATRQASNIVLLDSDFAAMPSVVAEGRRVINNIERSASLYLVKNIFSFALACVTLFFTLPYPFSPSLMTLVNMTTIGIPSFILAMEPNRERVSGRFLPKVMLRALPAAIADFLLVIGLLVLYTALGRDGNALAAVSTVAVGAVGLYMIDRTCRPYNGNIIRIALTVSMTMMLFVALFLMQVYVTRAPLSAFDIVVLILLLPLSGVVFELIRRVQMRILARAKRSR